MQPKNKGGRRIDEDKNTSGDSDSDASSENWPNEDPSKGHGHRPASDYDEAQLIKVAHEALKKSSACLEYSKGKLFNLAPGTVLRIVGQPWLRVCIYKSVRLRCPQGYLRDN